MKLTPPTRKSFWVAAGFAGAGLVCLACGSVGLAATGFLISTVVLLSAALFRRT